MLRSLDKNAAADNSPSVSAPRHAGGADASHDGLPVPRRYWSIVAVSFGTALLVIDGSIANVALPAIARELGVSNGVITNIVTVYQLVLVMLLLPFASLGDRLGHRRLYQIGQFVFMAASGLCLLAENLPVLLGLRALQAVGAAMALSVSAAMVRTIYPAKSLGTGMGINSVIVASSAAIAPTLGGYIVGNAPWQWVFVAAAPLAVVSLLLGRSLPDPEPGDQPVQWLSGIWSAGTMLLLIGGIQVATHGNWLLGVAVSGAGVVSMILLVRRERGRTAPVVPVDLLSKPVLGLSALASIASFVSAGMLMLALPFRLDAVFGYEPEKIGLLLLPMPLTMLVVAPLAGWLSDRIAATKLGVTGMTIAIIALLLIAFMPMSAGETGIAWRLSMVACGFGLFFAPNARLLIGRAPMDRAAAAGGIVSTSRLLGQALAAVLVGMMLAAGMGFGPAPLFVAVALAVVAAACTLLRFSKRERPGRV